MKPLRVMHRNSLILFFSPPGRRGGGARADPTEVDGDVWNLKMSSDMGYHLMTMSPPTCILTKILSEP